MFEVFYCVNIIPVKLSISLALVRIAEVRLISMMYRLGSCPAADDTVPNRSEELLFTFNMVSWQCSLS
jgi:hypothetical protein